MTEWGWTVSSQKEGYSLSLEPQNRVILSKECRLWIRIPLLNPASSVCMVRP